ncbi:MAG TPA: protein translocase subunit SecDF [Cyclobacteriaceae bacterium]|nr:protein translocase subunit SecDF [Cyclobacteriaceae bacterium]
MINKNVTILLTVVVTLLCIYYLSFTFVSRKVQSEARDAATDSLGNVNYQLQQRYLDSVWNEPVWNLFGIKYTYKEVKEIQLGLGLDLQGGMHVTLEVAPADIIKGLSGFNEDPVFLQALARASEKQRNSQENFTSLFYESFRELHPNGRLAPLFATAANRGRISFDSSDDEILAVINTEVADAIDRSFQIITNRIDQFGTSSPNIQRLPGSGRLQVELPGVENRERIRNLLQGVAKLEFWEVYDLNQVGNVFIALNNKIMAEQRSLLVSGRTAGSDGTELSDSDGSTPSDETDELAQALQGLPADSAAEDLAAQLSGDSTLTDSLQQPAASPLFTLRRSSNYGLFYAVKDTSKINRILQRPDIQPLIPNTMKFLWMKSATPDDTGEEVLELYALKVRRGGQPPLTGEVIVDARPDIDDRGRPAVSMQMNAAGAKIWRKLTADNINQRIAIVLDNRVYSAPNVQNEIPNGNSSITGNFTIEETKDLSNVLKTGKLPAPTRIVEEAVVGPSLGKQAQSQGMISIIGGLLATVVFMVAYYARGGLVANLALVFNIFFILGILAQMNAALTLPGIAGIVLTIGMAVDANVLIYERIREELRGGATLISAINQGFSKAYGTIIDSNLTTFITALIMFIFGQGAIRGFATTLMIGIVCSVFTAVFISRVIITWITRNGTKNNVSFDLGWSKKLFLGTKIDFMGKRKIAYVFSVSVILIGIILIVMQGGLNMGVDFKGGRSYVVQFKDPVQPTKFRSSLVAAFQGTGTEVKSYGSSNSVKVTTSYLVDDESSSADTTVENALVRAIHQNTGLRYEPDQATVTGETFTISGSTKVGATIADDIKQQSLEAVLLAFLGIFIYIVIRFKRWQYGLGAVVALIHDSLIVVVSFAYARLLGKMFEVDQVFIAAVLTVIGYSINDTVVIFDRVREYTRLKPGAPMYDLLNESLNATLSRTIITSGCTFLSVVVLLIFGGEALRGFSFALIIGIIIGTYSSVYIAIPLVLDLIKKKEPKPALS